MKLVPEINFSSEMIRESTNFILDNEEKYSDKSENNGYKIAEK